MSLRASLRVEVRVLLLLRLLLWSVYFQDRILSGPEYKIETYRERRKKARIWEETEKILQINITIVVTIFPKVCK